MTITWQAVSSTTLANALPAPTASGVYWQADVTTFLLGIPNHAYFQVQAGAIQYACLGEQREVVVRMLGDGLPAAAAWVQQGYLALHAAAVATPGGAVLLAGPSAAGKSTLAAALAQRGYPILTDEITPLCLSGAGPLAMHAVSDCDVLLWQDAMTKLDLDPANYAPLRPGLPRYIVSGLGVPCTSFVTTDVRAIYLLDIHNDWATQETQLDGSQRVMALTKDSFNRFLPQPPGLRQHTFLQLATKLVNVPVYRLLRPRKSWSIIELADRVTESLSS